MSGPKMLLCALIWIVLFGGFFAVAAVIERKRENRLRKEAERAAIISENRKRLIQEMIDY